MAAHGSNSASVFSGVRVVGGGVGLAIGLIEKSLEPDDLVWRREYPPVDMLRNTMLRPLSVRGPMLYL